MALQIRRGLAANLPASPADGELLYTTDTNILYVGDGGSAQAISGGGISNVVEDVTPQLGGNLDVNGFTITSAGNGTVAINPDGTGDILLQGLLTINDAGNIQKTGELNITPSTVLSIGRNVDSIDGNLYIVRNSASTTFGAGFTYAQHYPATGTANADATNFTFYRTRGTGNSPTVVLNGDDLADISFIGWDGSARASGAAISATVEGTPVSGHIPTKLSFATDNGTTIAVRAELSSTGVWKTNTITALTTDQNLAIAANGTGSVGLDGTLFKASTMTMPPLASEPTGAAGKIAVCDGTSWNGGGDGREHLMIYTNSAWTRSGLQSRVALVQATASLANNAIGNITFTSAAKGYVLYKIQTSAAAWVRLYTDISSRTADASRAEGVDPSAGAGVVAEVITTGAQTILISPGTMGFNNETSPVAEIYAAVTNKTGGTATITVTITVLKIEV
jgi:hypothetical protein